MSHYTPIAAYLLLTAGITTAAPSTFTIDSESSTATGSLGLNGDTTGTLIGDYDADTNPEGTQTRPGFFGGSGNNAIPIELSLGSTTEIDTAPAGSFTIDADTEALTATLDGFSADLLNGDTIASSLDISFLYETFRTINPSSLYPGGIALPLSFDAGELTTLTLTQSAPAAPGALIPQGDGSFTFAAAVPVQFTIAGSTLGGAPIDPGPTDIILPIAGTYTPNLDGSATVALELDLADFSESIDTSGLPPLPEIPFDLPTLTGDTASVLLNLALNTLTIEGSGAVSILATAEPAGCNPADIAQPFGVLDLSDIGAFVNAFITQDSAADLNTDGIYDLADLAAFVTAFQSGCP